MIKLDFPPDCTEEAAEIIRILRMLDRKEILMTRALRLLACGYTKREIRTVMGMKSQRTDNIIRTARKLLDYGEVVSGTEWATI